MTDLRTRPVEEQRRDDPATGIRTATGGRIIVLALVMGVLVGGVVFARSGSSRAELEQARWQQVVDYYERQHQTVADARAQKEAAYWQDVINHYARQYALIADASNTPATGRQSVHWEAVVDYYEQQWELQGQ